MLLAAGFSAVGEPRYFILSGERGRTRFDTPQVVVTVRI